MYKATLIWDTETGKYSAHFLSVNDAVKIYENMINAVDSGAIFNFSCESGKYMIRAESVIYVSLATPAEFKAVAEYIRSL